MDERRLAGNVPFGCALGLLCLIASATASAQDCYRPAECDGDELCIGNVCAPAEEPLAACDDGNPCEEWHAICDDGYCKRDGVYCENPAGDGYEDNYWGTYSCGTGLSSDWLADEEPDVLLADPELADRCVENLVSMCGEDAPDISDECTDEQLATCTEVLEHVNELLEACGEEPEEIGYPQLASCCGDLADDPEEYEAVYGCVLALAPADCAELEDCYGDDQDLGADGTDEDENAAAGDQADAGGCSFVRVAARDATILTILVSAFF